MRFRHFESPICRRRCGSFGRARKRSASFRPWARCTPGTVSLIRAARKETGLVVVSIFVNPTQFGPSEDLDSYPRPLEHDARLARRPQRTSSSRRRPTRCIRRAYCDYVLQERYTEAFEGEIPHRAFPRLSAPSARSSSTSSIQHRLLRPERIISRAWSSAAWCAPEL